MSEGKGGKSKRSPRPKGSGSIFKHKGSRYYWISYVSGGKRWFESTKSDRKKDAQSLLTSKLGDTQRGLVVSPKVGKITVRDGLKAVINDLKMNGRKAIPHTQRRIDKHILREPSKADADTGYFNGDRLMATISTSDLTAYTAHRLERKASAASCNHELAIIRRAFRLAHRSGELAVVPHIPMLKLNNARQGFFERAEFDAILVHLPACFHAPLIFAFNTGWRLRSEVLPLTVGQVDLKAGVVRLEPGKTKNNEGRSFYVTAELRKVLKAQLIAIEELKRKGTICPYVFHRPDGSEIRNFRKQWIDACEKAGHPGKLFHDFRRSAVRTLERSGVPRSTAMAMVGHKTESIYRRYAIVDEAMHREAAAKLDAWAADQKAKAVAERRGQLRRFAKQGSVRKRA